MTATHDCVYQQLNNTGSVALYLWSTVLMSCHMWVITQRIL